mmetsp:Transcript_20360/g.29443  ORF Transcript_20360/g.29443 Transcript_20360/m.29443 type:complete len:225 (+) Transcript_20360:3-677(+)
MSTRIRRFPSTAAKQNLVRLLFAGNRSLVSKEETCKRLDYAAYTHKELKQAYLKKLQEIHPDKFKYASPSTKEKRELTHDLFVQLQNAWDEYEQITKMVSSGASNSPEANFTMFGVGCSFSDTEEEQKMRAEITDQACRGWFSSGSLPQQEQPHHGDTTNYIQESNEKKNFVSLCDNDLFVEAEEADAPDERGDKSEKRIRPNLIGNSAKTLLLRKSVIHRSPT